MSDPSSISRPPLPRGTGTVTEPFTLAPQIFLPFSSFPLTTKSKSNPQPQQAQEPISQTQHLKKILENLEKQQNGVRSSMLHALKSRSEDLVKIARKEIRNETEAEAQDDFEFEFDEKNQREKDKSVSEMFSKLHKVAKKGAKSSDFEFIIPSSKGEVGVEMEMEMELESPSSPIGGNGDVNLPGPGSKRDEVLRGLSRGLKDLVELGVKELEGYDLRSQQVLGHYRAALKRRERSGGVGFGSGVDGERERDGAGDGRKAEGKVGGGEVRRMSTGMPVPGLLVERDREPVRSLESIEELARRGIK